MNSAQMSTGMISQNASMRKAGDPSLSQGPAHKLPRHGPALCTPGVVVPPLFMRARTQYLWRLQRRAGSVKRGARGRHAFPSNGGAATSRRRALRAAAQCWAALSTFQHLRVGGNAACSFLSARLRPSLPALS